MKLFVTLFIVSAGFAGGWLVRELAPAKLDVFDHEDEAEEEAAHEHAKEAEGEKAEAGIIKFDEETRERLGIETKVVETAELPPRVEVWGRVIDPSPLLTLDGELTLAKVAVETSQQAATRAHDLFTSGENVPRKTVEVAEAQLRTDQAHLEMLKRNWSRQWGPALSGVAPAEIPSVMAKVNEGEIQFLMVECPSVDFVRETPVSAELVVAGNSGGLKVSSIAPSREIDARTQAPAYILRVEGPARPGQSVTGWLQLPGQAKKGFTIPSSALIRFGYQSWVFLETEPGEYKRIAMDSISPTAAGWFVEKSELKADSRVVVTGAQAVMSAEVGPAEEE